MSKVVLKHFVNEKKRVEIDSLIKNYGLLGYGLYWEIKEILAERNNKVIPYYNLLSQLENPNHETKMLAEIVDFMIGLKILELDSKYYTLCLSTNFWSIV